MKMLQNQMDSISLDVAQISAHAKAQVKSILEVSIHMHLLGTLYTDLLHICMLLYVIMLLYVHSFLCEMHSVQYGSYYVIVCFNTFQPCEAKADIAQALQHVDAWHCR